MVQYFLTNKHRNISTTNPLSTHSGQPDPFRDYMACFNKEANKVTHSNQRMDTGDFQDGIRADHFRGSSKQNPAPNIEEATSYVGYSVLSEESNREERHWGTQGKPYNQPDNNTFQKERRRYHPHHHCLLASGWKFHGNNGESFTPLNLRRSDILREVDYLGLIVIPTWVQTIMTIIGKGGGPWCLFHRVEGHHTEECIQLKREIEALVQRGELSSYINEDVFSSTRKIIPAPHGLKSGKSHIKKGKRSQRSNTRYAYPWHTLNNIIGNLMEKDKTSLARKYYEWKGDLPIF